MPQSTAEVCSKIAQVSIGERIAQARAESGLTQAQLASAVGLDRSVLAKIETGARRVSAVELVALGRQLHRRIDWFVNPGPEAIVSYRAAHPGIAVQAIDTTLDTIARDVELVVEFTPSLVESQPAAQTSPQTVTQADELAARARVMLGLRKDEPAYELSRLVSGIGLLAFSVSLGEGADAGTVLLKTGAVSVINGDHRVGRRRLALAHELGHYLVADPYTTDWRLASSDADVLEARLDRFARALLLPEDDLRSRWAEWLKVESESLRDAAVRAGSHYRVDMATLARRLAEIGLAGSGEAETIRQVRTKKADIVQKNLVVSDELAPISLPRTYERAVLGLYRSETISQGRALGLLWGTFNADDLPDLPPVPESEIWTYTS